MPIDDALETLEGVPEHILENEIISVKEDIDYNFSLKHILSKDDLLNASVGNVLIMQVEGKKLSGAVYLGIDHGENKTELNEASFCTFLNIPNRSANKNKEVRIYRCLFNKIECERDFHAGRIHFGSDYGETIFLNPNTEQYSKFNKILEDYYNNVLF
jgi:hypothetical protein